MVVPVVSNAPAPLIVPPLHVQEPPKVKSDGRLRMPPDTVNPPVAAMPKPPLRLIVPLAKLTDPSPVILEPVSKVRVPLEKTSV